MNRSHFYFLFSVFLGGCRTPTQVTVELTTDVACNAALATAAQLGRLGDVETRSPSIATTACAPEGRIGSFVVVPSGDGESFAVKVTLGHSGRSFAECRAAELASGNFAGCIVARRALSFIPHEELTLPIMLRRDCDGVRCVPSETCVRGACVASAIPDPARCTGSGCPDSILGPRGPAPEGGPDGSFDANPGGGMVNEEGADSTRVQGGASDATLRPRVSSVVAGGFFSCALMTDRTVRCWGKNDSGQLGNGTHDSPGLPAPVIGLSDVVSLTAGDSHMCALMANHTVDCWGATVSAAGGIVTTTLPTPVPDLSDVAALAAGQLYTCALRTDGTVRCWGENFIGQLGNGSLVYSDVPVIVPGLSGVASIAACEDTTCAVIADGTVWCWGSNTLGQFGNGTIESSPTPTSIPGLSNVASMALGQNHACARFTNNYIACWGDNFWGELGDETTTNRTTPGSPIAFDAVQLAAGGGHTCAISGAGGLVKCWGGNQSGEVGTNSTSLGENYPFQVSGMNHVISIAAGRNHTCAAVAAGSAWCWGDNDDGEIGTATRGGQVLMPSLVLIDLL